MRFTTPSGRDSLVRAFGPRRVLVALLASLLWGLSLSPIFQTSFLSVLARTVGVGLVALLAFGLFEQWPRRPPRWLARWVLQVLGVAVAAPLTVSAYYLATSETGVLPFQEGGTRLTGFMVLTVTGMLFAPWIAMSALLRQRDELVRIQAQSFERERGELERAALDARLRLLQARVQPHFLFNTLANIRELVESGSPQAPAVLNSLIAYLRAAVLRFDEPTIMLGQELDLVRAYLHLMQMRMPDRLQYSIEAGDEHHSLRCPPMTLMTLVENAVRHGIDPGEEGGRIDVSVQVQNNRCRLRVSDTGVGLQMSGGGPGTGLSTLRERIKLAFGDAATLRLAAREPHGLVAELEFPAQWSDI